ncbi:major facilitator superfamily domain-containing protein [Catenaria anguillulae PL171]|uniref:Major facilitator superfamily domain-containing protein n=1 Tax=Catenaria anguillulae PL171 TaxID=765915 RepID=A0A1Y2HGS2_9FUNG|nr:major facilitator superfamily domain-containing protein [Catenaria anguillulae PL171]
MTLAPNASALMTDSSLANACILHPNLRCLGCSHQCSPFMTFMVDDLKVTEDKNKLGVYTGWLTACMMIGALMSSYPWGLFADRYGRRPVMLIGMFSTGVLALLFGFSSSYAMAVVWRTLLGLMNGVVTTAKAQMAEVCSQKHMPRGFSIMSVAWGLGAVFGPMVGGWMARPATLYPNAFPPGSFFDTWAYALPGVFCCAISFAITVIIYVNLPETRIPVRPLPGFLRLLQADYALPGGTGKPPGKKSSKNGSGGNDDDESVNLTGPIAYTKPTGADRPLTLIEMIKDGPIRITAILYGCTAAIEVSLMEALMLWARLPHAEGGLAFSAADLGVVSSITGAMGLLYQLFLFEPIVKRFGALNLYRAATLFACVSHQFMPRIPAMVGFDAPHTVQIVMLAVAQSLFGICGQSVFTSIFILISNAALDKDKGASNGLGQTVASAARIVFPVVSGTLFSLSMYNSSEPFDYHLTFHFCNVLSVLTVLYSFKLDHTINLPRDLADRIHAGEVVDEEVIKGKKVAVDAVHA